MPNRLNSVLKTAQSYVTRFGGKVDDYLPVNIIDDERELVLGIDEHNNYVACSGFYEQGFASLDDRRVMLNSL